MSAKRTITYRRSPVISAWASIAGPREAEGPIGAEFDVNLDDDLLNKKTWEFAESEMLRRAVELAAKKAGVPLSGVGALISGDLNNQITASSFAARSLGVPFIGAYNACATFTEALILGGAMVDGGYIESAVCAASSHFCTAERQFRFPLELGTQRPPSAQITATAAGAAYIISGVKKPGAMLFAGTLGKVIDLNVHDANHMGAAMAPAVADTIGAFFKDTGMAVSDFDFIITGDLGAIGRSLALELLSRRGLKIPDESFVDCGASMYSPEQDAHAGGSGAGLIASVTCARFLPKLASGEIKRALIAGSGALMSWTSSQQGESIPGISFAVGLEAYNG